MSNVLDKAPVKEPIVNPKWIKPSMTLEQAARQADIRGFTLKSSWTGLMGLRIVAVPRA